MSRVLVFLGIAVVIAGCLLPNSAMLDLGYILIIIGIVGSGVKFLVENEQHTNP